MKDKKHFSQQYSSYALEKAEMSKFTKLFVWPKKGYKWNPKGLKNCRGLYKKALSVGFY